MSAQDQATRLLGGDPSALAALGFRDAERSVRALRSLIVPDGSADLPPTLLDDVAAAPNPDAALLNFERLAGVLASKASFFSVLTSRPDVCRMLVLLLGSSQHLSDILTRDPDHFEWLIDSGGKLRRIASRAYYDREIGRALEPCESSADRLDALRRLARRELLRIGTADLIGGRPIHRVADELSDLADATLDCVIRECVGELEPRYGSPKHEDGSEAEFAIIGLGKLGGQELNFSSDIDLMFAYSGDGMTDGAGERARSGDRARSVTNQEYFSRLSERIVQAVSEPTKEGFLYRVDMRLRPDGSAGALTMPINAYEAYYARRGELWERQMLIKARLVAGSRDLGRRFLKMIHPFIYPGHIDGRPVDEIHRIKQRIEGKLGKKGVQDSHLKLRSGGIRDIEFVVQCLQMIVGQVHSQVRSGHTLEAIQQLVRVAALTGVQGTALSNAYVFFRRLEHRLQMMHGLSDYALPDTEASQLPMARSMGFETAGEYSALLEAHFSDVQSIYKEIFSGGDDPGVSRSLATLCEVELGDPDAQQALLEVGFARPDQAHRNLVYLAFGHAPRIRGTQARRSFMELAPVLIESLVETSDPDQALGNLERLVSAYGAGNTLFQTINENPGLRSLLLRLCAGSEFMVGILVRNPGLLDWLTRPAVLHRERSGEELDAELDTVLDRAGPEFQVNALNGFKNRELLRIGSRDLLGLTDTFETFGALTLLAESILKRIHRIGYARLVEKWGLPRTAEGAECPYVVLALGKMGGRELNFGSDLDLVFVYGEDGQSDKGQGNLQFFVELSQMIVNDFEKPTSSGKLYGADARLRPEGASALLALSYDAYCTYLTKRARTWERMALSRGRVVAGDAALGKRILEQFELFVVGRGLESVDVDEIRNIRTQMELKDLSSLSIKTAPGGIVDVEFLVQLLQLRHTKDHPEIRSASTRKGLSLLAAAGLVEASDAAALDEGFVFLRTVEKVIRRQDERGRTRLPSDSRAVRAIARAVGFEDSVLFEKTLKTKMESNRTLFDLYIEAQT